MRILFNIVQISKYLRGKKIPVDSPYGLKSEVGLFDPWGIGTNRARKLGS